MEFGLLERALPGGTFDSDDGPHYFGEIVTTINDMTALPAVEKRFENDAILHRFDRMFSPYGFSSQNLGDAVAGYLIASWEIINNVDAAQNAEGIRRVREAVRRRMKGQGKVTALSDTDKQRYSEVFKYVTSAACV